MKDREWSAYKNRLRWYAVTGLALGLLMNGCGNKQWVRRNANTYATEIIAAQARQEDAAAKLILAADGAMSLGNYDECVEYAEPAMVIIAYAEAEAQMALYLAGLIEEEPAPATEPLDALAYCEAD